MRSLFQLLGLLWLLPVLAAPAFPADAQCDLPPALKSELSAHPQADTFIRLGQWLDSNKKFECAVAAYRSAIKLQPKSDRAFQLLGSSLLATGDLAAAADSLQQAIQISPRVLATHLKLALALEQLQRTQGAKAEWIAALKIDPHSTAALDGMSKHLIAEGKYPQAIELLRSASASSKDEKLAIDLAQAYGKSGMVDEAGQVLKQAIAVHPSSFPLTFALTTVLMNEVYLKEAASLAGGFATTHPENLEAQRLYLRVLITSQDGAQAAPLAHKLLASHPQDAYFLYANGIMELQAGNHEAAKDLLQRSVALNPDNSSAHFNLGLALAKQSDNAGARQQFEQALAAGGQEPEIHLELAKALRSLGESVEAQRQFSIYKETVDAKSAQSLAKAKTVEAEQQLAAGNAEKAAELYRKALESTPNDAVLNYKLSVALHSSGDTGAERTALEKAIQIDPDLALAQNQLGYLDSRLGDSASAEEHFQQAVRAAPAYTEAWINLAATLGMESKFVEADSAVASALKLEPKNDQALRLQKDLAAARGPQ